MSFRRRLLLIMLTVLIVAQLGTAVATLDTIRRDVLEKGSRELDVALDVARQLLSERGRQLSNNVEILASDYGFRAAVATQDTNTLSSVLLNHGERADADMVLLTDPQGYIMASSHHAVGSELPFSQLWQQAHSGHHAVGVVLQEGTPYQFVLLPIKAPGLIGWVGMGFILDAGLASELSGLTRLSVSFLVDEQVPGNIDKPPSSSEPGFTAGMLDDNTPETQTRFRQLLKEGFFLRHSEMESMTDTLTRAALLQGDSTGRAYIIIQHARGDLLAIFSALGWQLLSVFALTLVLTAVVAALGARSMTQPLLRLVDAARRIGHGERLAAIDHGRHREIGLLADTLITMQKDIDERESTLLHQSRHDRLTGLANRFSAQQDITQAVQCAAPFTLLRFSVRGFRQINDTFGYNTGDHVLRQLAERLSLMSSFHYRAYRLGGDEFLLLLNVDRVEPAWVEALHARLSAPVEHDSSPVALALSSGEVSFPQHGDSSGLLLRRAEIAMDRAHRERVRHVRYQNGQDEQHQRQLTLVRDLKSAVDQQQLNMVYQPKVAAGSGELVGMEALMRWQHPTLGFVPPDEFITLAEQSGSISLLTQWMMRTVCRQMDEWQQQGLQVSVAINLSAQDVVDITLPSRIVLLLQDYQLGPERLSLEVTESALIQDPVLACQNLEALRNAGLRIAVDDYGTGYSSLAQLKRLPVQELKIDKSFILKLDHDPDDRIIVRSTIELGHNLGLRIVAEGVETAASQALLGQLGCDVLQGYFISRPLPAHQVPDWIAGYQHPGAMPDRATI